MTRTASLRRVAGQALERFINQVLATDPDLVARCRQLAGSRLLLELSGPELQVLITLTDSGIRLSPPQTGEPPQVTIRGTPLALAGMTRPERRRQALAGREVEITGDVNLAHAIQELAADLAIDWEEVLAHYTGDVAAHRIGNLARDTAGWLSQTRRTLEQDLAEYLKYEADLVVERQELVTFLDQVDDLRCAVDRLEARLRLLEQRGGG